MSPQSRSQRFYFTGFVLIGLIVLAVAVLGPIAFISVATDSGQKNIDEAFAITPTEVASSKYTRIHVDVISVDEAQRLASLRVSGYHYCTTDCGDKLKIGFSLSTRMAEGPIAYLRQ